MSTSRFVPVLLAVALLSAGGVGAEAGQRRGGQSGGSRGAVGRAVPRTSVAPRAVAPRGVGIAPYRSYYYPYYSYGYPYYAYGYPYYSYGLGLSFGAYPYGYPYYGAYGSPYPSAGYLTAVPGVAYGGVRIQGAPGDAQVFADGYYVGVVDDFDGALQRLDLTPGPHRIEIRAPGNPPQSVDVRIEPGQTITYHADLAR